MSLLTVVLTDLEPLIPSLASKIYTLIQEIPAEEIAGKVDAEVDQIVEKIKVYTETKLPALVSNAETDVSTVVGDVESKVKTVSSTEVSTLLTTLDTYFSNQANVVFLVSSLLQYIYVWLSYLPPTESTAVSVNGADSLKEKLKTTLESLLEAISKF